MCESRYAIGSWRICFAIYIYASVVCVVKVGCVYRST